MKRNNVKTPVCLVLSLLLIFYSALLPASAADLEVSNAVPALVSPLSTSNSIPLNAYEGTFFVKNRGLGNYMQIDNNASYTNPSVGTKIELWDFEVGAYQKWRFIHVGEGYYKIVPYSLENTNLCIAVQEGKENVSQRALVLDEYHHTDGYMRKQWTIEPVSDATYVIRPRCGELYTDSDWIMGAGNGIGSNGRNVENRTRNDSLNYKDEWYLYYTILDCWHSNSNNVGYWIDDPTIYFERRNLNSNVYYDSTKQAAMDQWNNALPITISEVAESEADIKCYYVDQFQYTNMTNKVMPVGSGGVTMYGDTYSTNITTCYGDSIKHIFAMSNVTIYILSGQRDHSDDGVIFSYYTENEQKRLMTHELGHALGYLDHSPTTTHIMSEVRGQSYILTSADIDHIKQIYTVLR